MTKMSCSTLRWLFVDYRKHPMLLVYEITIGRCGSVGIQVVAHVLYTSGHQQILAGLGESGRKCLANLVLSRRRNAVKRLGNGRGNMVGKVVKLRDRNLSPPSNGDTKRSSKRGLSSSPRHLSDQTCSKKLTTPFEPAELATDADAAETVAWLNARNFGAFQSNFSNYSARELMRLSRDDFIEICGLSEGIRLYNALRPCQSSLKMTLYFGLEINDSVTWQVIHLHILTSEELSCQLLSAFKLGRERLSSIHVQGPPGVRLLLSNDIVAHMVDGSAYLIESLKDSSGEKYELLLKRRSNK